MLVQAKELVKFWKLSRMDGIVWIVTFLSTVLIDIDVGLISGLLASIASVFFQSVRPYTCLLGHVPNTELYLDTSRYVGVSKKFLTYLSHSHCLSNTTYYTFLVYVHTKLKKHTLFEILFFTNFLPYFVIVAWPFY